MAANDDPEERIRELERPLADSARASEQGSAPPTGPGYPPAPAPWSYSGPVPARPGNAVGQPGVVGGGHPHRRRRAGPGRRHRSLCGTPAFGGEVDHQLAAHHLQDVRPAAGHLDDAGPSTSRRTPTSPAAPPGTELSVAGINENRTLACDDNPVSVSGVSNTVVITGHCTSLSVSGVQNTVTVEAVERIGASGFNNKVTYHSGTPSISNSGGSNVVGRG